MANRVTFAVSATPIETLTSEDATTTYDVLAGEVGKVLGGSGDSLAITSYTGTNTHVGFVDGSPYYVHAEFSALAEGNKLTAAAAGADFYFVKHTGYAVSGTSHTTLGSATTHCVAVAIKVHAYSNGVYGGFATSEGAGQIQYVTIAWLQPGQAILLPIGKPAGTTQFGVVAGDLSVLDTGESAASFDLHIKSYKSDGTTGTEKVAVEFLAVI